MKSRYFSSICLFIFLSMVSCAGTQSSGDPNLEDHTAAKKEARENSSMSYTLGPGDEVSIRVWRNDDLNRTVKLDPSGKIYLPLAGEIYAQGMTVSKLREDITLRLSKYLVDPQVDVNATEISSQKVYVLGEVRSPGTFYLEQDVSAWEVISRAGGFTEDANRDNLLLIRGENGAARVNVLKMAITKDGDPLPDSQLRRGDIIYVPETRIANFERFMVRLQNIINPFVTLERGIILSDEARAVLRGEASNARVIVSP